jgi:hypothetical protein
MCLSHIRVDKLLKLQLLQERQRQAQPLQVKL